MAGKNTDWLAIEGAYRAGIESVRTIASAHGISEAMVRKKAKQLGWNRDPTGTKRTIVNAHMASSSQGGTQEGAQCAHDQIEAAAQDDIQDMERGLRVHRACLVALEQSVAGQQDPKTIKVITEAAALAINGIRKIRGLDTPTPADAEDLDAAIEAELAKLAASREAGVSPEAEGP